MSNALIPFGTAGSEVPAHLAALFGEEGNIAARQTIDQLSYRGKTWRRVVAGEETLLTKPDKEDPSEQVPLTVVNIIILDHNKNRSRAFYKGAYEPGKNAKPDCWSSDGVTPDDNVPAKDEEGRGKQCGTCAACPQSQKGSKITEAGKQSTACSAFKRLAVVPSGPKMVAEHPPMLLRLAQTSVWDKDNKENEAKGWYAWDQYMDMLRARGAKHTATVITKVKFDVRVEYPKLLFTAAAWASPEEAAAAALRIKNDAELLAKVITGGDSDGVADTDAKPAEPKAAAKPVAAVPDDDDDDDSGAVAAAAAAKKAEVEAAAVAAEKAAKKAAKVAAAQAAAEAAAKAAAAAAEDDDDDEGGTITEVVAKPAPKATVKAEAPPAAVEAVKPAAAVVEGTPAGLADLLNSWDDTE